jgi:hypothetical protein
MLTFSFFAPTQTIPFGSILIMAIDCMGYYKKARQNSFLDDISVTLQVAAIKAYYSMHNRAEHARTLTAGDKTRFIKNFGFCQERTLDDLHVITLRHPNLDVSNFKAIGLFTKHVMDMLPLDGGRDIESRRTLNAMFAYTVASSMIRAESSYEKMKFDLQYLAAKDRKMILNHLMYLMTDRRLNGEAAGMIFKTMAIMNLSYQKTIAASQN